jgi:uncharacterized protein (TIGR03435 family)
VKWHARNLSRRSGLLHAHRWMPYAAVAALAVTGLPIDTAAQSDGGRQAFEVATLKQNKGEGRGGGWRNLPGGRFTATGMNLRGLLRLAYGFEKLVLPAQQIVAGPDWIDSDRFDVEAKAATEHEQDARAARERSGAMLRTLLEEKFQLKAQLEQREMSVYALVMARADGKFGPQLSESTVDCAAVAQDPAQRCGITSPGAGNVTVRGVTMGQIAAFLQLSPAVGRIVKEETGLKARYNAKVEFAPPFIVGPGGTVPNPAAETGVSLPTALQDQLGLKLDPRKAPVDVLVIKSVSRLTAEGGGAVDHPSPAARR